LSSIKYLWLLLVEDAEGGLPLRSSEFGGATYRIEYDGVPEPI
ncbi:unnamed protein product, partial [marine sediment metagenome]